MPKPLTWDAGTPPPCPSCGATMRTHGKGRWRCTCGRSVNDAVAQKHLERLVGIMPKTVRVVRPNPNGRNVVRFVEMYTAAEALKSAHAGFHVRRESWTEGVTVAKVDGILRYFNAGKPLQTALPDDFICDDWEILD